MEKALYLIAAAVVAAIAYFIGTRGKKQPEVNPLNSQDVIDGKKDIKKDTKNAINEAGIPEREAALDDAKKATGKNKLGKLADLVNRKGQS